MLQARNRKGFTLIELLVVIAIIAILAAILFPVFAKAREKARQSSCSSNMKQLGLSFTQYNQDYDEKMPCGVQGGLAQYYSDYLGIGWGQQIYPYAKSTGVFKCPDDVTQNQTEANGTAVPVSYAANTNCLITALGNGWQGTNSGTSISAYSQSSRTVLLAEVSGIQAVLTDPTENNSPRLSCTTDGAFIWSATSGQTSVTNGSATIEYGRLSNATVDSNNQQGLHSNGANYLCVDGHVKWTSPGQVSAGVTAQGISNAATTTGVYRTGGPFAEGTGNGSHALTFSPL